MAQDRSLERTLQIANLSDSSRSADCSPRRRIMPFSRGDRGRDLGSGSMDLACGNDRRRRSPGTARALIPSRSETTESPRYLRERALSLSLLLTRSFASASTHAHDPPCELVTQGVFIARRKCARSKPPRIYLTSAISQRAYATPSTRPRSPLSPSLPPSLTPSPPLAAPSSPGHPLTRLTTMPFCHRARPSNPTHDTVCPRRDATRLDSTRRDATRRAATHRDQVVDVAGR